MASFRRKSAIRQLAATEQYELLRFLERNLLPANLGTAAIAVLVAVAFHGHVPTPVLAGWLAAVLLLVALRLAVLTGARLVDDGARAVARRTRLHMALAIAGGAAWGAAGVLLFVPGNYELQIFLLFVLGGMATAALSAYAAWRPAYFAFLALDMTPIAVMFLFGSESETSAIVAVMIAIYVGTLVAIENRYFPSLRDAITSRARLQVTQRLASIGGFTIWPQDGFTQYSDEWYRLFGFDPAAGPPSPEAQRRKIDAADVEAWDRAMRKLGAGEAVDIEFRVHPGPGEERWVRLIGRSILSASGATSWIEGTTQDLTDRIKAEARIRKLGETLEQRVRDRTQELETSERRLAEAQRIAQVGSWEWDLESGAMRWSDEALRIFGHEPGSVEPSAELLVGHVAPEDRPRMEEAIAATIADRQVRELELAVVRTDQSILSVKTALHAETGDDEEVIRLLGTVQDVTRSRAVQNALRKSETRYRSIIENMTDLYYEADAEGRLVFVSPAARDLMDVDPASVVGTMVADWYVHPSERQRLLEMLSRTETVRDFEAELRRPDGSTVWVSTNVKLLRDGNGEVVGVSGTVRDITARRAAQEELRQTEDKLRQAQKLEAIGELTGGVAHDFNNLLAVIQGNAELLVVDSSNDSHPVWAILRATHRGAELTHRLLAYSRQQALIPKPVRLPDLLQELHGLISMSLGDRIEIEMAIDEDLWIVSVDPGQLENAILNLTLNARDAMPDGGVLSFRAQNRTVDAEVADGGPAPGQYVSLSVQDTGTGMAPEVLQKAFDPFFTTKDIGKGSGLGLSMVHGFVNQSGGHVSIASEEGAGAKVTMLLPRGEQTPDVAEESVGYDVAPGAGEHVLLVEDDGEVRKLTADMLTGLGYQVAVAVDAESARKQIERELPDLILADVGLAGEVNGPTLVAEVDAHYPEIQVLFVTGYSAAAARAAGVDSERYPILFKPYRLEGLARAVHDALNIRRPAPASPDRA